jgi:hypothetical protein
VTQRPAEIDPTIISQCSTFFVMRLANDRDQQLIRSAVSDAAANLLSFLPSLGTREVFAFGTGVAMPTRMRFRELVAKFRPNSEAAGNTRADGGNSINRDLIASVIERWRSASMSQRGGGDDLADNSVSDAPPLQPQAAPPVPAPAQPAPGRGPSAPVPPAAAPAAPARLRQGAPVYSPPTQGAPVYAPQRAAARRPSLLKKPLNAGTDAAPAGTTRLVSSDGAAFVAGPGPARCCL